MCVGPCGCMRFGDAEGFAIGTDTGDFEARAVVSATGTASAPHVPDIPGRARFAGRQLHSADYPGPEAFAGQRVGSDAVRRRRDRRGPIGARRRLLPAQNGSQLHVAGRFGDSGRCVVDDLALPPALLAG